VNRFLLWLLRPTKWKVRIVYYSLRDWWCVLGAFLGVWLIHNLHDGIIAVSSALFFSMWSAWAEGVDRGIREFVERNRVR